MFSTIDKYIFLDEEEIKIYKNELLELYNLCDSNSLCNLTDFQSIELKSMSIKFNFDNYYSKIKNSYKNWEDLVEQVYKDINRLDFFLQNKNITDFNDLIYHFDKLYDIIQYNNLANNPNPSYCIKSVNDLYKWFLFINQSVFGLSFFILNILFSDYENNIYIVDNPDTKKFIKLNFSKNNIRYKIQSDFHLIEFSKISYSKVIKSNIECIIQFQCNQYENPEFIEILINQIQM